MNHDFAPDRIDGYPSFVCRASAPGALNWWSPERSGDAVADYCAGEAHLAAALDLLNAVRDPASVNFYIGLIAPAIAYPALILANIVGSMRFIAPMERGFIEALTRKAVAGRAPSLTDPADEKLSDEFRRGEAHAHSCLALARVWDMPSLVSDDVIGIGSDQAYEGDFAVAFIWTICVAAGAGALN